MINSMKWLAVLLSSSSLAFGACSEVKLNGETLCHNAENGEYLSKSCASVEKCFPFSGSMRVLPNQSPGFTMCYDLGGKPFFGKVDGVKQSVPFCGKDQKIVDTESLLRTYGPRAKKR